MSYNSIPKKPTFPDFPDEITEHIEQIVFGSIESSEQSDAALVFGGTHPGAWMTTIEANRVHVFKTIFVTGGHKRSGVAHHTWSYGARPEADVIREKLIEAGIAADRIVLENLSENSRDNILFIREYLRETAIHTLALICRSYAVGRQVRTFRQHIGGLQSKVISYDTDLNSRDGPVGRHNWRNSKDGRGIVWGEYLRIVTYGRQGDLMLDFIPPMLLEKYLHEYRGTDSYT